MHKKLFILLASLIISGHLMAHGLELDVEYKAPVVILKAIYDDHEAIANAKISIQPPDAEITFQSGITDINGIFVFIPDSPGKWTATVDDESGHKVEEVISVDTSFFTEKEYQDTINKEKNAVPCALPVWIKLVIGFVIILSLTYAFYCKKRLSQ